MSKRPAVMSVEEYAGYLTGTCRPTVSRLYAKAIAEGPKNPVVVLFDLEDDWTLTFALKQFGQDAVDEWLALCDGGEPGAHRLAHKVVPLAAIAGWGIDFPISEAVQLARQFGTVPVAVFSEKATPIVDRELRATASD